MYLKKKVDNSEQISAFDKCLKSRVKLGQL